MAHSSNTDHGHAEHLAGPAQRKKIWMVFVILAVITAIEFIIAFIMGRGMGRNTLFIGLTLVKAGYIVAEFMHLRHETKNMVMTILLPLILLLWLILACLIEANFTAPGNGWFPIGG